MCSRLSVYTPRRFREGINNDVMEQTAINFEQGLALNPSLKLSERIANAKSAINTWLNAKSEFYSRIAEFSVSRRTAIRIGIVLPTLMSVAVIAVIEAPIAAITAATAAAWIVYRLNKSEKGGAE